MEVDRKKRCGAACDRVRCRLWIEQQGGPVAICEAYTRASADDRLSGRNEGVRREHDFTAGTDVESAQQELQSVGPVCNTDAVRNVRERREGLLERGDFVAPDERAGGHDAV